MRIVRKDDIKKPFISPDGETIYEMIGRPKDIGGTINHSLAYVRIPPGGKSRSHYHKISEETYYIMKGEAFLRVNGKKYTPWTGHAILIMPKTVHQIINNSNQDLEFLVVSAPAWTPDDTFFV